MKQFNLKEALAGAPVVTRDGKEVTQLTQFKALGSYVLRGVVDSSIESFTCKGVFNANKYDGHVFDLFMKQPTILCNGIKVPAPETVAPSAGTKYYYVECITREIIQYHTWYSDTTDNRLLKRGLVHLTKEDALEHAKAMFPNEFTEDEEIIF